MDSCRVIPRRVFSVTYVTALTINLGYRSLGTSGWAALSNNRLPSGWQLTTTLTTAQGNITGFAFTVTKPDGYVCYQIAIADAADHQEQQHSRAGQPRAASLLPDGHGRGKQQRDMQLLGGQGIFLCYADNNLSANQSFPSHCATAITLEKSNVAYATLPATYPNGEFYQPFGVGTI
jgi:hypothetical protein